MPDFEGENRRTSPRTGEITEEALFGALRRTIESGRSVDELEYTEGDEMRTLLKERLFLAAGIPLTDLEEDEVDEEGLIEPEEADEEPPEEDDIPQYKGKFHIPSSYGPDSPEVKSIKKAHKKGQPVALYEFMQGMVDYGAGKIPSPRIWIEHKSGRRHYYNGQNGISSDLDDPVVAIEFINGGPGLSPEDTIINRHGGGDHTLGEYGKGMTLALVYLKTLGLDVTISSHFNGHSWSGSPLLKRTESGVARTLVLDGEWGEKDATDHTCFRVEYPPRKLLDAVTHAGDLFLYANPKYPEACLVDPDNEAQEKVEDPIPVSSGSVRCVDGVIENGEDGSHKYIYIDGLRIPLKHRESTILPWSVKDLSDARYYFSVKRSHDSLSYSGGYLSLPLLCAVQQLENKELLRRLVVCAVSNPDHEFVEFSVPDYHLDECEDFNETTSSHIKEIWAEEYGENTLIASSQKELDMYKKFGKEKRDILLLPSGLYKFLERAGISTALNESSVQDIEKLGDVSRLYVPSASRPDKFEKLMDYIAGVDGDVELKEIDGEKCMVCRVPRVVKTVEEFNGQTENNHGVVLRTAAIIAASENLDHKIFSIGDGHAHETKMDISSPKPDWYSTKIEVHVKSLEANPKYKSYDGGTTYIILSGEGLEDFFEGDPAAYMKAKLEERDRRRGKMPKKKKTQKKAKSKEALDDSSNDITIGQIDITNREEENGGEPDPSTKYPIGNYQFGTGSLFRYDSETEKCHWQNQYEWKPSSVAAVKPVHFDSCHVETGFNSGYQVLPILIRNEIVGYQASDDSDLTFFRDKRTGLYAMSGSAERVELYTKKVPKSKYENTPPLEHESDNPLEDSAYLLLPYWQEFIREMQEMEGLSVEMKVAYAQNMWNHYFVYDDSKAIGDQVHARAEEAHLSEEELKCRIAARILNRSRGICNLSATGFVLLLKAIGVPSRLCAGYWKQGASSGRHAWVEYWNGEEWLTHESQVGVRSRDQFIGKSVEDVLRAFDDRIRELSRSVEANQAEVTDLSASKVALLAELEASEAARESIRMEVRRVSEQRDTMEQALRAELAELTASGKDREGLLKRQLSDAGADVLERDLLIAQARRALEALRDENPLMVTRGGYQERLTRELGFLDQQES